jgi:hypothetical protein
MVPVQSIESSQNASTDVVSWVYFQSIEIKQYEAPKSAEQHLQNFTNNFDVGLLIALSGLWIHRNRIVSKLGFMDQKIRFYFGLVENRCCT